MSFQDRVILITGSGSGIGRQLARVLSAEGAKIAALDRDPAALESLSAELAGKPLATALADVTDLPGTRVACAALERKLGPIDILIANAGIGIETSALNYRGEDVAAQINVNLIGVSNSVDAVLPGMRLRRRGHLVVISSLASYRGLPRMAGYCASKAGVSSLFEALRIELKPEGIITTTICPGWIRTPLTENIKVPQPYMMEVDYAVGRMVEAIRAGKPQVAFPARGAWRVRLLRFLPATWSDWLVRRYMRKLTRK